MTDWDHRFLDLARGIAAWSKDRSTKVGAVIVNDRRAVVAAGYNGFPRGVNDDEDERHERPAKYLWSEHAERNAIYNAVAPVAGCTMYTTLFPCAGCARAIVQTGIRRLVSPAPDFDDERWGSDFIVAYRMLNEAGVRMRFADE